MQSSKKIVYEIHMFEKKFFSEIVIFSIFLAFINIKMLFLHNICKGNNNYANVLEYSM